MRLSDVLSKAPDPTPAQIEGFLDGRPLEWGKHRKVKVGKVFLNYLCFHCADQRTFQSADELCCLGLGDHTVSVDVTLRCTACDRSVEVWFLVACDNDIHGVAPEVRLERYTENLRDRADRVDATGGQFADLVKRANLAYEAHLGAGSMIYLRKILESITFQVAGIAGIATRKPSGGRRPFEQVLQEVNQQRNIMPHRYSSDGYKLFSELSEVIHGDSNEDEALQKFEPCLQLVVGVVEEVVRDNIFAKAIDDLGWGIGNVDEIAEMGVVV